jgi:hypothetical protein
MPTGRLVRQSVFDHQTNGQGDDAVRVMCPGQGQVRHLGVEILAAFGAMMDGIGEMNVVRTAGSQISHIMQHASRPTIPVGTVPTPRAGLSSEVSAALDDLRFGQVLDAGDAFGGIGQILPRSRHGKALLGSRFQARNLAGIPSFVITRTR